jgi:hypothetical protein
MSETTSDTNIRVTSRPPRQHRINHRGENPSRRPPISETQRQKLSEAQQAYVTTDPRWAVHRQKLADAQIARRMTHGRHDTP